MSAEFHSLAKKETSLKVDEDQASKKLILLFLISSFVFVYVINKTNDAVFFGLGFYGFITLPLAFTIVGGMYDLSSYGWGGIKDSTKMKIEAAQIKTINTCHQLNSSNVYIFMGDASKLTFKYGATTGMRTAIEPSNYNKMNEEERIAYLKHMKPYILIDTLSQVEKCTNQ